MEKEFKMQIQRNLLKKKESGRSMLEMLGVLAIIGVLSVGAVAGYRYAMRRIEVNKILDVFRFVHTAAFSAYYQPGSFTSCCSFDSVGLEGHHMTGCDQNKADWRAQQRDEIKSYLPDTYCSTMNAGYCMLKGRPFESDNRLGWIVYPVIRNAKPVMVIGMKVPSKDKQAVCSEVIRNIVGGSAYQNLYGVGTLFEASWAPKSDFSEQSIQEICSSTSDGVAFYFNLPSLDQCDPQTNN